MKKITIDPVTRIEGHAKITIQLDDEGSVADTQFHVTQVRGFEKFTEGRPFYEMPSITARICGICPVSHLLASAKACDAIMAVRIPPDRRQAARAAALRPVRAVARAQLLPPLRARPAAGLRLRSGAPQRPRPDRGEPGAGARRHRAAQVRPAGHRGAGEGAHPSVVDRARRRQRAARRPTCATASSPACPRPSAHRRPHAGASSRACSTGSPRRSRTSATRRPCTPAWWTPTAACSSTTACCGSAMPTAQTVADRYAARATTPQFIGEATLRDSYLKAPYYKPLGYPGRRLPRRSAGAAERRRPLRHAGGRRELAEFRQRFGPHGRTAPSTTTTRG